jgi:hypothetical protein
MQQAMHAARLVAAQSALLALLIEQQGEQLEAVDGVTVSLARDPEMGCTLDVIYTDKGRPVAGEGA